MAEAERSRQRKVKTTSSFSEAILTKLYIYCFTDVEGVSANIHGQLL